MYSQTTVVRCEGGLHARPASDFVSAAGKYKDLKILVSRDGTEKEVSGKSIVMVLSLAIKQGDTIRISADGIGEEQAVNALIDLLENL